MSGRPRRSKTTAATTWLVPLALCCTACPTLRTVDVVESPELRDQLSGTLVFNEWPRSQASGPPGTGLELVLVDARTGSQQRVALPQGVHEVSSVREDGSVLCSSGGEVTEYSLQERTSWPLDLPLDELFEPGARVIGLSVPQHGSSVAVWVDGQRRNRTDVDGPEPRGWFLCAFAQDRMYRAALLGNVAWSADGRRMLHHSGDGLFEFRAAGDPVVRRIGGSTSEPVAIGYFEGEPCMARSTDWRLESEHQVVDWPLRELELPGLDAGSFIELEDSRVLYISLPTHGHEQRRAHFTLAGSEWYSVLRVCEPASGRTVVLEDRYEQIYGPSLRGYSHLSLDGLRSAE